MKLAIDQPCFECSADHASFYTAFGKWMQESRMSVLKDGIYYLTASRPVPRCLKDDPNGILYIGKGKILYKNHRLGKLVNSLKGSEAMHEAGIRYNERNLQSKYPPEELKLKIYLVEDARTAEVEHLRKYSAEFGELPPLNHSR